ncbi:MAG: hypothetical protein LBH64_03350 [Coriobacteriales bacterium]|nr:hypothetical protein [Coriobacteriales bacterium]
MRERLGKLRTRLALAWHTHLIRRSRLFKEDWYVERCPEARSWPKGPAAHYLLVGWKQGLDPSPLFLHADYLELNDDVAQARHCPLLHYELHGKKEGRLYSKNPPSTYKALRIRRALTRWWGRRACAQSIRENKDARILVVLHLFYEASWVELREYLKNLSPYNYDLIISYCDGFLSEKVLAAVRRFKPGVTLVCRENTGADVRHFHAILKTVDLDSYDIVFKLHSKGTKRKMLFIYRQLFIRRDWLLYLFEGILGARTVHTTIATLKSENAIGMMAASNLIVEDPPHKKKLVYAYMERWGIPIPEEYRFVAGTCFAVRAKLLKPLQALDVDLERTGVFSPDPALERIYCLEVFNAGYRIAGNPVMEALHERRNRCSNYLYELSTEQLYEDGRFTLDEEFFYMAMDNRFMDVYEVVELPLKDLRRSYPKKMRDYFGYPPEPVPLTQTEPYRYLRDGDKETYRAYCEYHQNNRLPYMTEERFDALVESIQNNGFDPRNLIIVNASNVIKDGQHRACCLYYTKGGEFKVPVQRVYPLSRDRALSRARRARHLEVIGQDWED